MGLFKKDAGRGAKAAMILRQAPKGAAGTQDIRQAQDTVQAITAALKSGAEAQDVAAKRLSGLTKAMEKMDASVRHAARLEAETTRLSAELKDTTAKSDKHQAWAQEQEAKLANLQKERDSLRVQVEAAKKDIAERTDREARARDLDTSQRREIEELTRELSGRTGRLENLALTQQRVQDELASANTNLSAQTHKTRELENAVEELSLRLDDKTKAADAAISALRDLRLDHHAVKDQLVAATSRLQAASYESNSEKQLTEGKLKRRSDEIIALKTQVEQLTTQLRIKDTMGTHFDDEVGALRQALEAERERNAANEQRLRQQAETEARHDRALAQAKAEFENLHAKFSEAVADLDASRQLGRVQSQKLERYAELNKAPAPRRERSYAAPEAIALKAVN
jgi:chromosome segregation ATPase